MPLIKWNVKVTAWYQLCSRVSVSFTALLPWFLGLSRGKFFIFLSYIWQVESAECSGRGPGYSWCYDGRKYRLENVCSNIINSNPCVCVPFLWFDRLHNKWLPFSSNSLIQHTYPPTLSQYHFHFGHLPPTGGLTQSPALRAHKHTRSPRSRGRFWSTALPDTLSFITGSGGGGGNGSCASLLFPREPWKTLLLIPLNGAAVLTFSAPRSA